MQKECNIIMLPTNKAEGFACFGDNEKYLFSKQELKENWQFKHNYQHLYITSDDKIKEDDWVYDTTSLDHNPLIHKIGWLNETHLSTCDSLHARGLICSARNLKIHYKKIIATTDSSLIIKGEVKIQHGRLTEYFPTEKKLLQPSEEFIELFIKHYNAGNPITKVMIEYDKVRNNFVSKDKDSEHYFDDSFYYDDIIKINPDNTINIKTIKDSWSKNDDDLKIAFENFACAVYNSNYKHDMGFRKRAEIMSKEWIKQNL